VHHGLSDSSRLIIGMATPLIKLYLDKCIFVISSNEGYEPG
jgi:hypothetical protein